MKRSQQILVPFDIEIRVKSALHEHAGPAERDRFVDTLLDLFDRMNVSIRLSGTAIERTECTDDIADVGVIDIAVDDIRNNVAWIFPLADLVRRESYTDKIVRFEKRCAVFGREAFAVQGTIQNWLDITVHSSIILTKMGRPVRFRSKLETTDSDPPWHILRVPKGKVADFAFKGNLRRVVCSLNGTEPFNCALFPSKGDYFITLNKKLRERLGLKPGDAVTIELARDDSKFGMPMPDEFAEVLRQDKEGKRLFEALSPGNQRLMLKLIVFVKDVDKRIIRSLVGIEILKKCEGKFDYHLLHDAMRVASSVGKRRKEEW